MSQPDLPSRSTAIPEASRPPRWHAALALVGTVAVGLGLVAALGLDEVLVLAERFWAWLQLAPAPVFFGVMAVALMAPVPATVFYFTAGPIYGVTASLLWIVPVLVVNSLLVHAIGASFLRPRLEAMVEGRGVRIPRLERVSDQMLFLSVMRVTPGIPYFVQSWAVVLAGIDRTRFVLVSVGVQMVYATGFVVLGRSAFEGQLGGVVFAVAFIAVGGMAARWVQLRLRTRRESEGSGAPPA